MSMSHESTSLTLSSGDC